MIPFPIISEALLEQTMNLAFINEMNEENLEVLEDE